MNPYKISFLGMGRMASALLGGILGAQTLGIRPEQLCMYDKLPEQCLRMSDTGVSAAASAGEAVRFGDIIFLAVKPQNIRELFETVRESGADISGKTFVSIVAGVTIKSICEMIGGPAPVIRTIPNTPLLIGKGTTALSRNGLVDVSVFDFVRQLFGAAGTTLCVEEDKINAVTAATSSAPAYIYLVIQAIIEGAERQGLSGREIQEAVCHMVAASAEMVLKTEKTPEELIAMVTSPNGTTERAMRVLNGKGVKEIFSEAMDECVKRAEELSRLS